MAKESKFQKDFKARLKKEFPGCLIIKGNSAERQGLPDLLLLHGKNWASLELKRDEKAEHQPNQDWYVDQLNEMSYAAIVDPNNADEVISEIQSAFGTRR